MTRTPPAPRPAHKHATRDPVDRLSLAKAVLIAPLSIIPAAALLQGFWLLVEIPDSVTDTLLLFAGGAIVALGALPYSYGFSLIYCLPLYLWLSKKRLASARNMVFGGLFPAIVLAIAFAGRPSWLFFAGIACYSIVVSACFHLLADRRKRTGKGMV